jgi:hypothetical protein
MQHAKRMVLVDEREYEEMKKHAPVNTQDDQFKQLFDRYVYEKLWKNTPSDASKSYLSSKLQTQLGSSELADDVKAKQHHQTLSRLLNQQQLIKPDTEYIDEPTPTPPKPVLQKKRRKPDTPVTLSSLFEEAATPRRTKRKTVKAFKWSRFNDE